MFNRTAVYRILKETVCVAVCALLAMVLYHVATASLGRATDYTYIDEVRSRLVDYPQIAEGRTLKVRDGVFGRGVFALFVVTSPACRFCVSSADFNTRLSATAKDRAFAVAFVVPTIARARGHLGSLGLQNPTLIEWENLTGRASGTPAVVLVDRDGIIRRIWMGQLSKTAENEVLDSVRDPAAVRSPKRQLTSGDRLLSSAELRDARSSREVAVIDVSDRRLFKQAEVPGEVNIPLNELAVRASFELRRSALNVIDCTLEPDFECSVAIKALKKRGFDVVGLDLGPSSGLMH